MGSPRKRAAKLRGDWKRWAGTDAASPIAFVAPPVVRETPKETLLVGQLILHCTTKT